ncbi:MAG TPA: beta-galactosidase [Planctomycetota bacterium]|jgi:hypothetical protein
MCHFHNSHPQSLLLTAFCYCLLLYPACGEDWIKQEYTMEAGDLDTPTTKWGGEKYARGRLAVLIFQSEHIHEQDCRQPMELKRAFDFDVEYVYAPYGGDCVVDNDRARELLDARRWDVIVFWGTESWHNDYARCADDVKFRILSQTAAGTGLVFTNTAPPEVCRKDRQVPTPIAALYGGLGLTGRSARDDKYWDRWQGKWHPKTEEELRAKFFTTYQVGKGLIVCFPASPNPGIAVSQDGQWTWSEALPWQFDNRTDHEYMLAEIGRAILVASGKPPEVEFVAEPPALWKVPLGKTKGETAKWTLDVKGEKREIAVTWRLRNVLGAVLKQATTKFPDANGKVECQAALPWIGAGRYYLDLFADSPRGRETYGYSGIEVPASFNITIEREKNAVEAGQPVKGMLTVAPVQPPQPTITTTPEGDQIGAGPVQPSVLLKLIDNCDRVIDMKRLNAVPGEKTPFSFDTDPQAPMQLSVRAEIGSSDRVEASATVPVNILQRRHDRFNVVLWGNVNGPYAHAAQRKLWRTGVTSCMATGVEHANMNRTPFIVCWGGWKGEVNGKKFDGLSVEPKPDEAGTPVMNPCCWNDKENFEKMLDFQDKHWKAGLESAAYVYNMYDEGPHAGCCLHPACLTAYREWLKEEYGGKLDALNREWGSQYASWDDVNVLENNDNLETKAREKGNFARWSDRKHFSEVNFCRTILRGQMRRAKLIDPQARVGFEGSGEFGMDFDELLAPENTGFWCPYDGITTEMVRSLKQPGYIHSFWIGYQKDADPLIAGAWRMVMNGAPSIWWWMLKGRGTFHGWLASNNMPYPENQKLLDDCILPLRRGLGDLLMRLDMPHDGIALYYSTAAASAGEIGDSATFNSAVGAHENFVRLIEDTGFQWVYTTKKRVLAGDLEQRGIKLLILAFHQALGDDEVAALQKFVEAGGTILADLRPGVLSGHCRPVEHSSAEKLFGIERTGKGKAAKLDGELKATFKGQSIPLSIHNNRADGEIKAVGQAVSLPDSKVPVFITQPLGKGQTLLLNFHVTQYIGEREMKKGQAQRDFFRAFTSAIGLQPRLARTDGKGGELIRTETVTWQKGGVTLHALYRDGGDSSLAEIVFPQKRFVFDLRSGEKGETDRLRIDLLRPGYADFFAAYPYDPGQPTVQVDKPTVSGGQTATFNICMSGVPENETGTFSYETRLLNPKGEWIDCIPWSAQGAGGRVAIPVRFAYNDAAGKWTLSVREVTTGRKAEAIVEWVAK